MPGNYKKPKEQITFDALMESVSKKFATISDHRRANAKYPLSDFLCSAFAMFSLKSPSLLDFDERTKVESKNLKSIYHIGAIPSDTQMRAALDPVDPQPVRAIFASLFDILQRAGVVKEYHFWQDHVLVAVDGVEHFSSQQIHCAHCLTRQLRDGKTGYHHAGLAAVLVHPAHAEVFPLDFEPILKQDGAVKNDCERNAAKRLLAALRTQYPDLKIILIEDALYANAPHIRQINEANGRFILNVKPDSHASLFKQFAGRRATGQVQEWSFKDAQGRQHAFAWTKGLCLCESAIDVTVNFLWYTQTEPSGEVTTWTWITNLPLTKRTVEPVMRAGRSRWKIENETFNTLKNQGYHFEHNYGHGEKNLATVLALLMLLAFTVDQMNQHCWKLFQQVSGGLRTTAKLWDSLRSVFRICRCRSMAAIYLRIADLYAIQLC